MPNLSARQRRKLARLPKARVVGKEVIWDEGVKPSADLAKYPNNVRKFWITVNYDRAIKIIEELLGWS